MSARDWLEFDGEPGTSATDVVCSIVAALMVVLLLFAIVLATGRAIEAATDPAVPACEQAIADGAYTSELYSQCLDDYRDSTE